MNCTTMVFFCRCCRVKVSRSYQVTRRRSSLSRCWRKMRLSLTD